MQVDVTAAAHRFSGSVMLFRGVTFSVVGGQIIALVGPSGSGKSTLLAAIYGSLRLSEGEIRRIGIERSVLLFQNPFGVNNRTAIDHVRLPLLARGASPSEADELAVITLTKYGLRDIAEVRYGNLSGGQAQRLAIARASASDPDLLLMDEPTGQLDRQSAEGVSSRIRESASENRIVVIATHDMQLAKQADFVVDLGRP